MMVPERVKRIIEQEIESNGDKETFYQLKGRKGDLEEQLEDIYTGINVDRNSANRNKAKGSLYDVLSEEPAEELVKSWMKFHAYFCYPDFSTFYSKINFCLSFDRLSQEHLISLLADRKFLFLEDSGHGNSPDYPALSEIVRRPDFYLTTGQLSGELKSDIAKSRKNAKTVLEQGFVPTGAHQRAYNEMKSNEKDIRDALEERKELLQRGSITQFPIFEIQISSSEKKSCPIDKALGQLFHDFLYAVECRAYVSDYCELHAFSGKNSLNAIISVRQYLEEKSALSVSKALVFWLLFTKETAKLAKGEVENFKFKMPAVNTDRRLTRKTQAITYQKIECQIMLFDYLLKLLPPENEQETAYAKFQFHAFSKYNGYTHFRVNDAENLKHNPEDNYKFGFNLIPDSKDYVDHLGGVIRRHILRCISNDVRWLTPGFPNNWNTNNSILATLLLQDTARFPRSRRLTNRIYAFLKGRGKNCIQTYRHFKGGPSDLIAQLEKWCIDNDLMFEDDIPSSDMEISDDKMKLICSRQVLEYILKERALVEVRQSLSAAAQRLWGDLLLKDCETFYLDEDT